VSVLLYAVLDGTRVDVTGRGLQGRPLRAVSRDGLTAVISDHTGRPAPSADSLWTYERAVEQLMEGGTVLPARFGSIFGADAEVEEMLRDRRAELVSAHARVRGAVELGVRASWPQTAPRSNPTGPSAGTAYMLGRLELTRRAQDIAAGIDTVLGDLARAKTQFVFARHAIPVTASYLVDRDRADEFISRARALQGTIEGTELTCTGPWPPYSFVGGSRL
jgi:Gas vesicle synthesis protein GvpL/GvpF